MCGFRAAMVGSSPVGHDWQEDALSPRRLARRVECCSGAQPRPAKRGEYYGLSFTLATPQRMPVLTCTVRSQLADSGLSTTSPPKHSDAAIEFMLPSGEVLRDLEVRSNAHHGIHQKEIFGQWRVDLNRARPTASFQIPLIIPEDGCIEVVLYVNREARQHVALCIPAGEAASQIDWTRRPDIDESLLNIPEKEKDFPTQACRAFYMTAESSKDTLSQSKVPEVAGVTGLNYTCAASSSPSSCPVAQVDCSVPGSGDEGIGDSALSASVNHGADVSGIHLVPVQLDDLARCQSVCSLPEIASVFHADLEPMLLANHLEIDTYGLQDFADSICAVFSGDHTNFTSSADPPTSESPRLGRLCPLRNWRTLLQSKRGMFPLSYLDDIVPILERMASLIAKELSTTDCQKTQP